ncbi:MAG TPA: sigma 54-interacting transcriptional regulator [Candidatus Krumholzibacteriaceae bacterium]|nr:sigma 54-interacting transcriptional regulator [Candidatus Krumholzibacteriaceae bacterium]
METAKILMGKIESLLKKEDFVKALKVVEGKTAITTNLSSSPLYGKLLLLISKTYYFNKKYEESKNYLYKFELHYSNSTDKIDYIIQKFRLLLLEDKIEKVIALLDKSLENKRSEKEYYNLIFYKAKAHFWNGDYFKANHLLEKCQRYYLTNSDHYMLGLTLYMLGYVALQRAFYEHTEKYFNKALQSFKISRKSHQIGHTYKMLSVLNYRMGKYKEAKRAIALSERYFNRCSSRVNILDCQIARARIAMFESEYKKAEKLLLGTYDEAEKVNFKRVRALSAEFLGEIYYRSGNYEKALSYLREGFKVAQETAPRGDIAAEIPRRIGDVYIALGKTEKAEEMLEKAAKLCRHLGDKYELGCVYRAYALLAIENQDIDLARSYFNESIITLQMIKESFELASTYLVAAGEYNKWTKRDNINKKLKEELLENALSFAVEAVHLYKSINLEERAGSCKEIIKETENPSGMHLKHTQTRELIFNSKWLHGGIFVARSKETRKVVSRMKEVAGSNMPILITGETGTGKEVAAQFIHKISDRTNAPFVAVNCAAIQDNLFESELFGHREGAFTGASDDRIGLIEQADGGTLFLDEITELSSRNQAKFLRVLEDGKIRKVGENDEKEIDIRLISATNKPDRELRDSEELIRKDLYFRVAAELFILEPLRNRKQDIEALFAYYLNKNGNGNMIEPDVLDLLIQHKWPGNTRELVNLVKSIGIVAGKREIRVGDLPREIRNSLFSKPMLDTTHHVDIEDANPSKNPRLEKKKELLLASLERNFGNKTAAAKELGISRKTLYNYLKKLEVAAF